MTNAGALPNRSALFSSPALIGTHGRSSLIRLGRHVSCITAADPCRTARTSLSLPWPIVIIHSADDVMDDNESPDQKKESIKLCVCYMRAERRKWWHSALVCARRRYCPCEIYCKCKNAAEAISMRETSNYSRHLLPSVCERNFQGVAFSLRTGSQHFRFMLIGFCAKFHRLLHNFIVISRTNTGSRSFVCFSRSDSKHCGLTMDCSHKFVPLGCLSNNARAAVTPQTLESAKSANHSLTLWFGIVFVLTQKKYRTI